MNTIFLYVIMNTIFISYVAYVWIKFGKQTSISQSYYCLTEQKSSLFMLFCMSFGFTALWLGIGITGWIFPAAVGIIFVGAASDTSISLSNTVHMVAAITGIVFSQIAIWVGFDLSWITLSSILIAIPFAIFDNKHIIWWAEIIAYLSISLAMLIKLF